MLYDNSGGVERFTFRRFYDLHCHFRLSSPLEKLGSLLEEVLPQTARYARYGLAMPNTRPRAILTGEDVIWYRGEIQRVLDSLPVQHPFEPLMTIEIRDDTTPAMVVAAQKAGAVAGKVYPCGVTTNSEFGLRDFFSRQMLETFGAMQDIGMYLLLHGELDQERLLVTKREEAFLPTLTRLAEMFPRLRIVLEHVSTAAGVEVVMQLGPNVAATITAHHLLLTLNNVIGDGVRPHNACMPTPKDFPDRDALLAAAISGNPKFFLGSDTAPHVVGKKECAHGACGVYSAPVLPQVLMGIFRNAGVSHRLEDFTSAFGAKFYGLPLYDETVTVVGQEWTVPTQIGSVVPFRAGETLRWQLEE